MAGKIPQSFIDELLTRVDIVDVINRRVPLKKAGHEYKACCPFHGEKTPSFTVSANKQFYHCFGCGAHGSAIGFLMEYERLSFPEAIEELAGDIGLEVPYEGGIEQGPDHRPLYDILEKAARYFAWQLRKHPSAGQAIAYLQQRGLSGETAARFRVGYAPPGWDNLLRELGNSPKAIEHLRLAGLISEPDGKRYDRFRERIMFPIHDSRGRVVGFGGRVLGDGTPKYLNSPETPVFHKGRELYGLFEARKAVKQLDRLLVVEGYMDVIALAQFGIDNVVATLGTATTAEHLEKLFRATPEVVFCFDGDRAGRDAAWKALETTLPLMKDGRQARFLFLPEGEDPDSLVRRIGAEAFLQLIRQSLPLSNYLFDKLAEQVDMGSIDGRARLAQLARPHIERLPAGVFREMMQQELAKQVGTERLAIANPVPHTTRRRKTSTTQQPGTIRPVHRAIALLLQHPELAREPGLPTGWQRLHNPGASVLKQLFELLAQQPDLPTAALVERWEDAAFRQHLGRLATLPLAEQGDQREQFIGVLEQLDREATADERRLAASKLRPSEMTETEKQRLRELYRLQGDEKSPH